MAELANSLAPGAIEAFVGRHRVASQARRSAWTRIDGRPTTRVPGGLQRAQRRSVQASVLRNYRFVPIVVGGCGELLSL
jgi:hypothetical protein